MGLEKKVIIAVTDNGSNMVKAIGDWNGVERVPCSAHTLQLCVLKGLKKIKPYLRRFSKLNQFFESPKQTERLEYSQREIIIWQEINKIELNNLSSPAEENGDQNDEGSPSKPLKILRTITEIPTHWESKLAFWKRLKKLKEPIKRMLHLL